jgi:ABC-type proline/glycine betaine transport system substrate-binding protein
MMGLLRRHRTGVALSALLTVGMALTACGGGSSFSGGTSSGSGGSSSSAGAGMTIKAAEFPWSAAKLTNVILTEVATQHPELGVSQIEPTTLGPAPAWAGGQRGDLDLFSEVALPNQQELADKAKDKVSLVHQTYGDAQQGWFVPTYATQPGQPLAGLTSVTQLNDYAVPLNNKLVDADPSFITTQQNAKRLQGYGLKLEQVASSEAAQLAELRRAYQAKEPILVYLYHRQRGVRDARLRRVDGGQHQGAAGRAEVLRDAAEVRDPGAGHGGHAQERRRRQEGRHGGREGVARREPAEGAGVGGDDLTAGRDHDARAVRWSRSCSVRWSRRSVLIRVGPMLPTGSPVRRDTSS